MTGPRTSTGVALAAVALALALSACKPGHHPPPPAVPEEIPRPESEPPGVHDPKPFDSDGGILPE